MTSAAVVVPVKAFRAAKVRLAPALAPAARAALARELADVVVGAASPLPVLVVCDDDDVRDWALAAGAEVVWCPDRGLNGAVSDGVAALAERGIERAVVAHSDLPLATTLAWVADFDGVTLVPDRRVDGTNVAAVPTGAGFEFSYGKGSFARHRAEAARCGLEVRVVEDAALGWDVDLPDDLAWPRAGFVATAASTVLSASSAGPSSSSPAVPPVVPLTTKVPTAGRPGSR
jgi:2-phospho-L-lactate guanylyltransferase